MFNLDSPWKIVQIVALLLAVRLVFTAWKEGPYRELVVELADSGLVAFALVFLLVRPFVIQAFYIPTGSMRPTLEEYDRILVNKFIYRLNGVRRGDVAVFRAPDSAVGPSQQKDFIKRVVGLPGETVTIRVDKGVFIDGRLLREPYISEERVPRYDWGPTKVPPGEYLVLGDNRNNSNDSHHWGTLPRGHILGKAMAIFWPPGRMGLVR
jgi:signal peptidase I